MARKSSSPDVIRRFSSKGVFPHQFAFTLLIPLRNIFLSPRRLISRLRLEKNFNVLEVGPGPGYFSTSIARILTEGKLTLADIQQEMLDKARKRITRRGITNVEYVLCDGEKFLLQDEIFDVIFMVTVIGEVENKENYMKEFHRLLKEGGILSISELKGDPDKLTISEVKELAAARDFVFSELFGDEDNYTINFRKNMTVQD
jgi:ubiquinone/menaquinone biosynthesis C-methylase UbiE